MKNVAILTIFNNNNNYGGVLQAFALHKKVKELGYNADVLYYVNGKNPVYPSAKEQLKQYGVKDILKKVTEKAQAKIFNGKVNNIFVNRAVLFDKFRKEHISTNGPFDDSTLVKSRDRYFAYISGSDQIWNPNAAREGFLLSMIDDNHRKIAYAASIGRSVLSAHESEVMIPLIKRYDSVSVREKTAQKLLAQKGVENVKTVLDPTLILDKREWQNLCVPVEKKRKYVLCYFFSENRKYREEIDGYCKKNDLDLYYIPYANQCYIHGDHKGKGIKQENVGPVEFLSLINNAEAVFTDSFHGTVFSIIFNKNFVVYERDKKSHSSSKNSRIYDLLGAVGLDNRLYSGKGLEQYFSRNIDFKAVEDKLQELRKGSIEFLEDALN
ncbi:MAG: polysaccharide pyruvyl transferase family protein [Ruminococcus sp.]